MKNWPHILKKILRLQLFLTSVLQLKEPEKLQKGQELTRRKNALGVFHYLASWQTVLKGSYFMRLFIVEGDSAGGSANRKRREFQQFFLYGENVKCGKSRIDKVYNNDKASACNTFNRSKCWS